MMCKVQLQISFQYASFLGIEIIETSPVILYIGLYYLVSAYF